MELIIGIGALFAVIFAVAMAIEACTYDSEAWKVSAGCVVYLVFAYCFFGSVTDKLDAVPSYTVTSIKVVNTDETPMVYKVTATKELSGWYMTSRSNIIYTTKTNYKLGSAMSVKEK